MTKPKGSSKPKTSISLCCFGSSSRSNMESSPTKGSYDPIISKMKKNNNKKSTSTSWFSWRRIRLINKNSAYKTVPLESSNIFDNHAHYSKSKSKSTLHHKPQAPAINPPPPPPQPAPVLPGTPYYTPTQTRHGASNVEDTRQHGRASPAHTKRQVRRLSSPMQTQTTPKKAQNAYDPVVGMSVLVVTLVIMLFWGRLCAILCTSVWLYCTPRFRESSAVNDDGDLQTTKSKGVDLDSEEYKKKVIMEGLLGRNHRAIL